MDEVERLEKIDPTPGYDSFVGQTFDVNGGMNVQAGPRSRARSSSTTSRDPRSAPSSA